MLRRTLIALVLAFAGLLAAAAPGGAAPTSRPDQPNGRTLYRFQSSTGTLYEIDSRTGDRLYLPNARFGTPEPNLATYDVVGVDRP